MSAGETVSEVEYCVPVTLKALVECHGGMLTIESAVGIGTRVRFSLPPSRVVGAAYDDGTAVA